MEKEGFVKRKVLRDWVMRKWKERFGGRKKGIEVKGRFIENGELLLLRNERIDEWKGEGRGAEIEREGVQV